MALITLFIDTGSSALLKGISSTQGVPPTSLPFFYGDTPTFNIYLLSIVAPSGGSGVSTVQVVPTNGLTLLVYVDDGTITPGTIYTQQIIWAPDPTNSFFSATMAFNTAAISALIGTSTGANGKAYLKIGYVQNGVQTTVFSQLINIGVGIPNGAVGPVPPGQTPLTVEVARQMFMPQQPVNGLPLILATATGRQVAQYAEDNADGSASVAELEIT